MGKNGLFALLAPHDLPATKPTNNRSRSVTTLGSILIALAVLPSILFKKKTRQSLEKITYPVFGIGWILVGIGNFMGGSMIGSRREYNLINSYTLRETWTMESDPIPFVLSNVAFILIGVGTIMWSFLRKNT